MISLRRLEEELVSTGLYIIGTDTEVGKTAVAAGVMYLLMSNNINAAYFKPVASGEVQVDGKRMPADAAFVKAVSGFQGNLDDVTPFAYSDEVSPHLAARRAHRPIDRQKIYQALDALKKQYDVIIGEAAGGLAVPLDDDGYMQHDLIRALGFPCLLVARAGLGTINHTLLTLRVANEVGLNVRGIVISGSKNSELEQDNVSMIRKLGGIEHVFVLPAIEPLSAASPSALRKAVDHVFRIDTLTALMGPIESYV